jgi:hypothetical protein
MSQSKDFARYPLGQRYEAMISQQRSQQEATDRAKREDKARALQEEIGPQIVGDDIPYQPQPEVLNEEAGRRTWPRQAAAEGRGQGADDTGHSRNPAAVELAGAPITSHEAGEGLFDVRDLRNNIQILQSQLERERSRVSELERDLAHLKREEGHYTAVRNAAQGLQVQAVMSGDTVEIERLRDQVRELGILLEDFRRQRSRLEQEISRKDRMILELRAEIRNMSAMPQPPNVPNTPHEETAGPEIEVRRGSSRRLLKRNNSGMRVIEETRSYPIPTRGAFLFT